MTLKLPIGISDFKEVIEEGCYFADKTLFIKEVITNTSKVVLFTRPRRFGKTMNLSMLNYFLTDRMVDITPQLFSGTSIAADKAFCQQHQNQHPVIFVTFKGVKESSYLFSMLKLE